MTLKDSYYNGLTGLNQQLNDAFDAGSAFIVANLVSIASSLTTEAANGNTKFTITLVTNYKTVALRLNGLMLKAYLAGITAGLAAEDLYSYEVIPALNTTSTTDTKIDLNFTFATT